MANEKTLREQVIERVMGVMGDEPFRAGAVSIRPETLAGLHAAGMTYDGICEAATMAGRHIIQYPDLTRPDARKLVGAGLSGGLATATLRRRGRTAELVAASDVDTDEKLLDVAWEMQRTRDAGGAVIVADADRLDEVVNDLDDNAAAGIGFTPEAVREFAMATIQASEPAREGAPQPAPRSQRIDAAVPDPAMGYGADADRTVDLGPAAIQAREPAREATAPARSPEQQAREAAMARVEETLRAAGMLASPEDVAESERDYNRAAAGEQSPNWSVVEPDRLAQALSALRSAVSLLGEPSGTGEISNCTCEVTVPIKYGRYLSVDESDQDSPVHTLRVFPSGTGFTGFDTRGFKSVACAYDYLMAPAAATRAMEDYREIDDALFGLSGSKEPCKKLDDAFRGERSLYNPERGLLVTFRAPEGGAAPGDREATIACGVTPEEILTTLDEGGDVMDDELGRNAIFTDFALEDGPVGGASDYARLAALVSSEDREWEVGGPEELRAICGDRLQLEAARAAEETLEAEPEQKKSLFSFFAK